ncbi:TlpA family protein disulfide reductase [Nocardioides acrostichi]|uniref:TlpA family protein disulfide reductase n=1 Tax=Nocardioides acrostichi TaxID=2784339 RepID=A0A930V1V9_9ACTN|nr:TlpA disulfide reductase family protein [Nocardioides acrostichi]MBF4163872.1 TlpA family protein disulfide reductase [Nocardioides acrostichi]
MRRGVRTGTAGVFAAVLVGAGLAGCSGQEGTGQGGYISGDGSTVEFARDDLPGPVDLTGPTVDGGTFDSADARGKVLVVNVWWSGCAPCIQEMPMLTGLHAAYGDAVGFVGINIKDDQGNARIFEKNRGVDYPSILDPDALLAFPGRSAPRYTPTTLVLDPDGRVTSLINGEIPSQRTLEALIESAGGPAESSVDADDPSSGPSSSNSASGAADG